MESFTVRKVSEQPNTVIFTPPPYCKTVEKEKGTIIEDEEAEIPPLKLGVSNPAKLLHLWEKLTDDSSKSLEMKINSYLIKEAACNSTFIIRFLPSSEEAVIQVVGNEDLEIPLRLSVDDTVIKRLVQYEDEVLKCDDHLHFQIVEVFRTIYPVSHHQIISVPILNKNHKYYPCSTQNMHPIFLVCFVDSEKNENFLIKLANEAFRYCQTLLINTMSGEKEERRKQQSHLLLETGRNLFSHLENIKDLLTEIQFGAKRLALAKKCLIFLVDANHIPFVANDFSGESSDHVAPRIHLAKDHEIAAHVAKTGELVNLRNSNQNLHFTDKNVNEILDFTVKNLLCFPLRNTNQIVGVALLCNKNEGNFDEFDEELFQVYGIYCGLAIAHSLNYKYIEETRSRSNMSNMLLTNFVQVSDEDVAKVATCPFIHSYPELDQFSFCPQVIPDKESICFVLRMFEDLGFMNTFSLKRNAVIRFIILVKRCYKDIPYHNWQHALTATHFAYLILKILQLEEKFISSLEAMAYFISCLCHDVDYWGMNNPFQQHSHKSLACLYSSAGSITQRHQVSQTLTILNTEGCNFLEPLQRKDYILCLDLIKDFTLATDLATHIKLYRKQYEMAQEGYNSDNPEHRYVLMNLLMVCSDLSEQLKDWTTVKQVTENMYEEFFTLSDLRRETNKEPIKLKDRGKVSIPDMQIDFLKNICLSPFKILGILFPKIKELVYKIKENIMCWETSRHIFQRALDTGRSNIDVLSSEEFEQNVEAVMKIIEK